MKDASTGNYRSGNSTLEILIAFAVLTLTLSAVIMVIFGNQSMAADAHIHADALFKAEALLASERALARQSFDLVASVPAAQEGIYASDVAVEILGDVVKKVTATVRWSVMGRTGAVELSTLLTDTTNTTFCGAPLGGDWKHPQHYDFPTATLIPRNTPNGIGIADIKLYQQKIYLAAYSTVGNADTFYIFDAPADPSQTPIYQGSLDNAPTISSAGLNALALAGTYAFAASGYGPNFATCSVGANCAQLQIIDVSDAAHPAVSAQVKVPGVVGSGGQGAGWSITYDSGYVYLGLVKTGGGAEFHIFDVGGGAGSPLHPVWKGAYSVGRTVNAIRVRGTYAYLATDDNARELIVLDISDKSNPTLASVFNPPGSTNFGYGYDVARVGNFLYFGRTYASNAPEFYILDATSPTSTPIVGSIDIGTTAKPDSVDSLVVRDNLAFLLTNTQFQIWNVSDPAHPAAWSADGGTNTFLSTTALGGQGGVMACGGNDIYAAIQSSQANKDSLSVIIPGP